MRKFALLLAAALVVSVPLAATMTTDSYAAAKKAKKAAKKEAVKETAGPQAPFATIIRAIGDLGQQLATNRYVYEPSGGEGKGGKKSEKRAGKKKAKKA